MLRISTTKRRTHSLLRQGIMLYELIPTMPKHRLLPLMARFASFLQQQFVFTKCSALFESGMRGFLR